MNMALLLAKLIIIYYIRSHFTDLDSDSSSSYYYHLTDAHRKIPDCVKQTTFALSFDQSEKYASKLT